MEQITAKEQAIINKWAYHMRESAISEEDAIKEAFLELRSVSETKEPDGYIVDGRFYISLNELPFYENEKAVYFKETKAPMVGISKDDIEIVCEALNHIMNSNAEDLQSKKDEYSQIEIPKKLSRQNEVYNKFLNYQSTPVPVLEVGQMEEEIDGILRIYKMGDLDRKYAVKEILGKLKDNYNHGRIM